jgi:hypothetical protein
MKNERLDKENKNNKVYTDLLVSVDIESNGPIPGSYSMTSFGAALAGTKKSTGEITMINPDNNPNYTFYRELKPISENYIDDAYMVGLINGLPKTATPAERQAHLLENGSDPNIAMPEFNAWLRTLTQEFGPNSRVVFTAFPLGFDWMFIYWYLIQYAGESEFGFSGFLDIKTLYAAKSGATLSRSTKRYMPKHLFSTRPHTHNALDDAIEQGELAINLLKWDGK